MCSEFILMQENHVLYEGSFHSNSPSVVVSCVGLLKEIYLHAIKLKMNLAARCFQSSFIHLMLYLFTL